MNNNLISPKIYATILALHFLWGLAFQSCNKDGNKDGFKAANQIQIHTYQELTTEADSAFEALEDLNRGDRENWQKPQMVISRLGDLSDKVVADIGAGSGYFSMPLARKASKVIAIDIEEEFLDYINRRLSHTPDRKSLNIETRLTNANDPMLKPNEVDLVLLVNTYAFIDDRVAYFQKVRHGLKPDGQLVIIDFKKEPLPVGPPTESKLDPTQVSLEMDSAGFRTLNVDYESLDYQYTITLVKRTTHAPIQ